MSEDFSYQEDDASKLAADLFGGKLDVEEALVKLRTRLLDLSMRNRLLNYKHPKGRSFQFVGEPDLDLVFERLEEGRSVPLLYVPDPPPSRYEEGRKPDVRTFARELGIGTSIDIGLSSGMSSYRRLPGLQLLQYPSDLERLTRKVSSEARTVVEETGTNMLYLVFGFLEYFDSEDSAKPVHAPLLSMPVVLNKGRLDEDSRTYLYELAFSGEDVVENFTLREKLRQQFRLELPELDADVEPEVYLAKIQAAILKRPNWRVLRRLTLSFLSFGKLAIWADLDPTKAKGLLSSDLLKAVFGGTVAAPSAAFHAEDYDIDAHADGDLPLIYDADSSQHSALIDVKNGKNLVINGPPGTGKSQTITNIVATAIASGKKVLFVSEKLAALEVVKQRLSSAGLGDFCLELHSHKTQKKQMLEAIDQRMSTRFRPPAGYEARLGVLRERRKGLNAYAQLLGARVGNELELTVHEVLWAAESKRVALGTTAQSLTALGLLGAADWRAEEVDRRKVVLADAAAALVEMGGAPEHSPWRGYIPKLLVPGDEQPILDCLTEALAQATTMVEATDVLGEAFNVAGFGLAHFEASTEIVAALEGAPRGLDEGLLQQMFKDGLEHLSQVQKEAARLEESLARTERGRAIAKASLRVEASLTEQKFSQHREIALTSMTPDVLEQSCDLLATELKQAREHVQTLRNLSRGRPTQFPAAPAQEAQRLQLLCQPLKATGLCSIPADSLIRRANAAAAVAAEVARTYREVRSVLLSAGVSFAGRVDEVQQLLDGSGLHELLPATGDASRNTLEVLRQVSGNGWAEWTAGQFAATSETVQAALNDTARACENLQSLLARLGIPFDGSRATSEAVEILLQAAERAPLAELSYRSAGFDRSDFDDVLQRAEGDRDKVVGMAGEVARAFHSDALPNADDLRRHVQTFRRGDSFFNFASSDWRRAKAAYKACIKDPAKQPAAVMAERFAFILGWHAEQLAFETSQTNRDVLGGMFAGVRTDFQRARRLRDWLRGSRAALLATSVGHVVNVMTIPAEHIELLVGSAAIIRSWLRQLGDLDGLLGHLPGLDPAVVRARRFEERTEPLSEYARALQRNGALLKQVAQPPVTVQRAAALLALRDQIEKHKDLLQQLADAPVALAPVGADLGMGTTSLSYQHLGEALDAMVLRADQSKAVGKLVGNVGESYTADEVMQLLPAVEELMHRATRLFSGGNNAAQGSLQTFLPIVERKCEDGEAVTAYLEPLGIASAKVREVLEAGDAHFNAVAQLEAIGQDQAFNRLFGTALAGIDTDRGAIAKALAWGRALQSVAARLPSGAADSMLRAGAASRMDPATAALRRGGSAFDHYKTSMEALNAFGFLDWSRWGGAPLVRNAVERLEEALAAPERLLPWSRFLAAQEDAGKLGLSDLLKRAETGAIPASSLVVAFEYVFFRTLSRNILGTHRQLARFSGTGHEQLRGEFAVLDKELIALNGALYASKIDAAKKVPPGIAHGRASDLTELALLTKETKKQKRHIPIRQLLKRAGRALQELKPCFMMGPLSVAQYLEQGQLSFDLIVMDEASQLRPEDSLGAIGRGKQLVVVGDPKQLPPTSFFDRLMDDDDEGAESAPAVVEGVESILGICEHLFRPVRTLRWHYRSRHESLIAFSNSQFYRNLIVFPSPYQRNRHLGVNYRYVKGAVYQERRNFREAERVADAVVEHMLARPEESLGVVTLNQTQRELIEDILDKKLRDVAGAAEYLERHEKVGWPFFVKNLENVQGDERDVIFVSTTFGKPEGSSSVRQNFGPINRPDGWRRLNVLFTRARYRLDLFTSMLPSDISVEGKTSLGRRALRDYLEFARSGNLPPTTASTSEREADSDFEIAVGDALRAHGFDCESQVGVAGYFIDIGVRHPDRQSEFLAGIECDGVTYHSSLSARDRDRIRQEILETLGWRGRIARVWSSDWFADPKGQIQRLVEFLEHRMEEARSQPALYDLEPWNTDDVVPDGAGQASEDHTCGSDQQEIEAVVQMPANRAAALADIFVEVDDRVTYETTVDPIERHSVQLVDSPSNLRLGLLNDQTPLAQALLGLRAGETGELVVKDQPARLLRVVDVEKQKAQYVANRVERD